MGVRVGVMGMEAINSPARSSKGSHEEWLAVLALFKPRSLVAVFREMAGGYDGGRDFFSPLSMMMSSIGLDLPVPLRPLPLCGLDYEMLDSARGRQLALFLVFFDSAPIQRAIMGRPTILQAAQRHS